MKTYNSSVDGSTRECSTYDTNEDDEVGHEGSKVETMFRCVTTALGEYEDEEYYCQNLSLLKKLNQYSNFGKHLIHRFLSF